MSSTGVHLRPLGADELEDASREDGELSTTSGSTPASAFASESDWSDADEEDWERCSQTSAGTGRSVAPSPVIVAAVPPSQPAAVTTTAAAAAPRLHSMQPLNMIQTRHVPALQASSLIRAPLPQAYRHVLKGLTEMRAHLQVGIPAISAAKLTAINPYASAPQTPLPPPTSKAELLAGKAKRRAKLQSCISAADASVALVHFHLTRAQEAMRQYAKHLQTSCEAKYELDAWVAQEPAAPAPAPAKPVIQQAAVTFSPAQPVVKEPPKEPRFASLPKEPAAKVAAPTAASSSSSASSSSTVAVQPQAVSITPQCVVGSRKRKDLTPIQLSKRWIPRRKEAVKDAQALLTNETKSSVVTLLDLLEGQRTDALAVQTRLEALIHLEAFLRGDAVAAGIPTITLEAFTEGILPRCIRLLQPTVASQSHVVVLQLLDFCIACSSAIRAIVIHHDALLLAMFALCKPAEVHISVLRAGARTLAALCCCEITPPVFARLQRVMDVLAPLVHSDDDDVIETACLGLAALSQDLTEDNSQIQAVISSGVCKRVAELLLSLNPNVHTAALRLVGNLVTGDTKQTQTVLNSGVMPGVVALMSPEQPFMPTHRAVCWTLSNILAGDDVQIACALRANVVTTLTITLQTKNATEDEQSEAAWALSNAMTGADDSQVRYLKSQGFTPALCGYFNQLNSETKEGDEAAAGGSESKPLVDAPPQAVHVALTGLEFTLREAGAPDLTAYSEWVDSGKGRDVFRDMISMYCAFVRIALPVTTRDVSMEMSTFHSLLAHCRQIFQAAAKHSAEIVAKTAVAALRSCFNETVPVAAA